MASVTIEPGRLDGIVDAPPSKSLMHRAVLLSALAGGKSQIAPVTLSEDIRATLSAVRALGARWTLNGDALTVMGGARGARAGEGLALIDCAESGSTLRFLVPIALALGRGARFVGRGRLNQRPMEPYERICRAQGIAYERREGPVLDLRVEGQLKSGAFELPGDVSSQFVSGLLMALPLLRDDSTIRLTSELESRGYIGLTLDAMKAFGVKVQRPNERLFKVPGKQRYRARDYHVEGDYSQAAVFLCAAALGHGARVRGLPQNTLQGDQAVLSYLMRMGAQVWERDGISGACSGELHGAVIDGRDCPDILPILALAGALAEGETRIVNAARLRLKESDRIAATCEALSALGARAKETEDGMVVEGVKRLRGGVTVGCAGDHRIAMLLAVAALHADAPVTLTGVECLNKSYPNFFKDFQALGGIVHAG
ncbi:3-phosphoshikimate 1-carboxyvinyltransferase [Bacillota bacterium Meth-B3]